MRPRMLIPSALATVLTTLVALAALPLTTPPAAATTRGARVYHALNIARAQIGDPYQYGAAGPSAFDCSGLMYYSFHRAGFTGLPRTSAAQARFVRHIPRSHMRPGDLVFFYDSSGVYHVGIFARWRYGHRVIIHAPYPGKRVQREPIWTSRWFAGTLR
jgi:cell wall-associated NlpC family hydrolase